MTTSLYWRFVTRNMTLISSSSCKQIIIVVNCWCSHGLELKINSSIDDRLSAHFIWLLFLCDSEASFIFIFCFSSIGGTHTKKKHSWYFLNLIMVTNHILGYLNQKWLSVESPKFPVVEDLLQVVMYVSRHKRFSRYSPDNFGGEWLFNLFYLIKLISATTYPVKIS